MDALLAVLHPDSPLPYEKSAPPGLFTSVLRQLRGVVRGGSALEEDRRVNEEKEEEVVEEEERRVSLDPSDQRAFVLESGHSCYKLRLEDNTTVSASTCNDWLSPGYAT